MIEADVILGNYRKRIMTLWLNPKYKRIHPDKVLIDQIKQEVERDLIPRLESIFNGFTIDRMDTTLALIVKELLPYIQSICPEDALEKFRTYYRRVKADPRIIVFLGDFYDNFLTTPIPFETKNQNLAFEIFAGNFEACINSALDQHEKIVKIHDSICHANAEYWSKCFSLFPINMQLQSMKNLGKLEQLRSATEIVGKITAISIEPMVKHVGETIAIVLENQLPHDFRPRINYLEANLKKIGFDSTLLKLGDLAFIRNAVAHGGISFDYTDEKISLTNVSKKGSETRRFSDLEILEYLRVSLLLIDGYGEYMKYGVYRFASTKGAKRQWIQSFVSSFQLLEEYNRE